MTSVRFFNRIQGSAVLHQFVKVTIPDADGSFRNPGAPGVRDRGRAFTLTEMLVAMALLLMLMTMASTVFKVTMDGTGQITQLSEVNRSIRMFKRQLSKELANIDPAKSIMAIQGNPAPAYWTHQQKKADSDYDIFDGIDGLPFSMDPERENPTLGYQALDNDGDGSFDPTANDNIYPQLPRADILMFITNIPSSKSFVDPEVKSDGPVMVIYNHAELGKLRGGGRVLVDTGCPPGVATGDCDNDSTDDWIGDLRPIPELQGDGGMDTTTGFEQDVAQDWHLARRAILLKRHYDSMEDLTSIEGQRDRFAHVLSPTNPAGNQYAGFVSGTPAGIDQRYERHYLNWILGGEMDVVSPVHPTGGVSGRVMPGFFALALNIQDFFFKYEVENRYFGAPSVPAVSADMDWDLSGTAPPNSRQNAGGFWRGGVPAFWLARSHLDPEPPASLSHRLGHYFLPNCASFKVEWTPNDIRLEQAGLPEVVWIDPFKEPENRLWTPNGHPINSITGSSVSKPFHLDEFEILAQKMAPNSGTDLFNNPALGPDDGTGAFNFGTAGSYLYQVHQGLKTRFGLSLRDTDSSFAPMIKPTQMNVYDFDPRSAAPGVQPSYNTHTWYAKDLAVLLSPKTLDMPDPMWPKALRITIDLFDDAGRFDTPVRHVFVLPVGARDDRKQKL